MRGDHAHRRSHLHPVVHRDEHEGLRPPSGRARTPDPLRVHIVQGAEKVDGPEAVPELQPHQAQPPQLLPGSAVPMPQLRTVVVSDHVVRKRDVPLPGEGDTASGYGARVRVLQASIPPVAVRTRDAGKGATPTEGTVQVPRHEEPRPALEVHLLHRVLLALDPPEHLRIQGASLRHRPEPHTHQDMAAKFLGPSDPRVPVAILRKWEIHIAVSERPNPRVLHRPRQLRGHLCDFGASFRIESGVVRQRQITDLLRASDPAQGPEVHLERSSALQTYLARLRPQEPDVASSRVRQRQGLVADSDLNMAPFPRPHPGRVGAGYRNLYPLAHEPHEGLIVVHDGHGICLTLLTGRRSDNRFLEFLTQP